ncbi:MAG TPA: helix-turn-helix domain-containing protein [Ktedonobacteraceae bacterium]|nr:helix-turn-helix domain-containing protein [Ktedonobacteraceae bacterium]
MAQTNSFKGYYTAKEVKERLGITDGMLYNYVRYGHLERVMPPGRKQGVYKKEEVDKFALEMQAFLGSREESKSVTFTPVSKSDIEETVRLTNEIFHTQLDRNIRLSWVTRNPQVSYQLCVNGSVLGVVTMLPLKPEKIEQILRGEANSEETKPEEIEVYEPGRPYHLYAMGVGVSSVLSRFEKRLYGSKLITGLYETILEFGKQGIEIETISARSHTVDGIRILRHIGFKQIPSITKDVNFCIDVPSSEIPFAQQYREALASAKARRKKR